MRTVIPAKKRKNPYERVQDIAFWTLPPLLILSLIGSYVAGLAYARSIDAWATTEIEVRETKEVLQHPMWDGFAWIGGILVVIALSFFLGFWGTKALDRWRDQRREWNRRASND